MARSAPATFDAYAPRAIVLFDELPPDVMTRFASTGITHAATFEAADAAAVLGPSEAYEAVADWNDVIAVYPDRPLSLHMWQAKKNTRVDRVLLGRPPLRGRYTGKGVTIAVVDTGIEDTSHPDLAGRVAAHVNFDLSHIFQPTAEPTTEPAYHDPTSLPTGLDPFDHGTSLAAVAAGTGVAAAGNEDLRGVAPGATLVDVQVSSVLPPFESSLVAAFEWVLKHRNDKAFPGGIRVALSGIAGDGDYVALRRVLRRVMRANITTVFPTGNGDALGSNEIQSPARYPEVVSVGGVCKKQDDWSGFCAKDRLWRGSRVGSNVDVVAPAVDVWTAQPFISQKWSPYLPQYTGPVPGRGNAQDELNNRFWYSWEVGTSFSAAQVAGIIALMLDANPRLTPREVQSILKRTATDGGKKGVDTRFGHGVVDALRAVAAAEAA